MVGLAIKSVTVYDTSLCVTFFSVLRHVDNIVAENNNVRLLPLKNAGIYPQPSLQILWIDAGTWSRPLSNFPGFLPGRWPTEQSFCDLFS